MSLKKKMFSQKEYPSLVISSPALRKCIGIMGMTFPILLVFGSMTRGSCDEIQNSISAYYYTNMRDLFIGTICLVSMLLMSYNGYDKTDKVVSLLAGIFGMGIAFFPTTVRPPITSCVNVIIDKNMVGMVHLISAALFFFMLFYLSYFRFTKSGKSTTPRKQIRNKLYRICGIAMITCIMLIAVYMGAIKDAFPQTQALKPIFWLEFIALVAFGLSWLTKGGAWLRDRKKHPIHLLFQEVGKLFKTS